ncbi:mediator of RNA polymerase II transcription subunit 17-like isoform X2 [Watersipora subatra]
MHLSDNLAKLAQLIDFGEEKAEKDSKESTSSEAAAADSKAPKAWPWDWLRNSLMAALTEMNVLSDCLAIAKEKRFMVLDQIASDTKPETKSGYQLMSRKQALHNASAIFNLGAQRLEGIQQDPTKKSQPSSDFYNELWQLRQNWRIKKVGQHILGDLSYKSTGSTFWHKGTFEVFKKTSPQPGESAIDVRIPPELEGSSYIQVSIHMTTPNDNVSKLNAMLTIPQKLPTCVDNTTRWQTKLETAQNIIFCKELFSQLSREAFKLNSTISHMVVNNQIIVHLFPGFKMHLMYVHSDTEDKAVSTVAPVSDPALQLALHELLREQHYLNLHKDPPHPVTGSVGPTKRRRIAGPSAASREELMSMERPEQESILEKIVEMARHVVLRLMMVETVEHMALTVSDPLLHLHTDGLSNALCSSLRVTITSPNYDSIKSWFILKICGGKVTAIGKSAIEISLSHETQKLEDYIMWQVSQYHIQAVYKLSQMMGCNVLSHSFSSVSSHTEVFGAGPSILVSSSDGSKAVAVRANTISGVEVLVSENGAPSNIAPDLITDKQWALLRQSFKQVDLARMAGRNFTHKIELLLSVYSGKVRS